LIRERKIVKAGKKVRGDGARTKPGNCERNGER